jgi:hypothetical protein
MRNAHKIVCGWKTLVMQEQMDLKKIGCEDMDWIHLDWDRINLQALVNMAIRHQVPYEACIS